MATLYSADGEGLVIVVKDCDSANKSSEVLITSQSVGSKKQRYRVECYVDGTLDLQSAVQLYTVAEFDAEFSSGVPDLTLLEVDAIATAALGLFAIAFSAKMVFRFLLTTRAGRF